MYVGGGNAYGIRHMALDVIDEQLAAPGARPARLAITLHPGGVVQVEIAGAIADVRPEDFLAAEPADGRETRFWSLPIAGALSEWLEAEAVHGGTRWAARLEAGVPAGAPVRRAGEGEPFFRVRFRPDRSIFHDATAGFLPLCSVVQEKAIFHPDATFRVADETNTPDGGGSGLRRDFRYPRGLLSYAEELGVDPHRRDPNTWRLTRSEGSERAEAVCFWPDSRKLTVHSFVNGRRSLDHGSHVRGFLRGVRAVVTNSTGEARDQLRGRWNLFRGMTVLLAVDVAEPAWEFATRTRLLHPGADDLVYRMVTEQLHARVAETLAAAAAAGTRPPSEQQRLG
jgi:DNA gyrase/topoisomerase IV subunit B